MPRVSEGSRGGPAACPLPPGSLPHSPLPRRRGLGSRASAATAAAERLRVGPARASGPPGPWPCPRPLAAVPEPGSAPRPGLNRFRGFRARQQPRPRAPARAMGRLRGARGRLPPGGLRAPPGRRTEGAFPGAGSGARATVRSASGRCARFGPVALCPPGCCAGAGRPCGAAPFLAEHPGPALRSGIGGPRPFARSLGLVSRPPAGRGARNRAGSARNWPPVGDICIARPRPTRPARPHPRGGTRPAAAPPPAPPVGGLGWGLSGGGAARLRRGLSALCAPVPASRAASPPRPGFVSPWIHRAHRAWCLPGHSTPRREG